MAKKSFLIGLLSVFLFSFSSQQEVYICKGKSSKKYHKSSKCRGLSNCSTSIYKVSLNEAKNAGRTACKIEY